LALFNVAEHCGVPDRLQHETVIVEKPRPDPRKIDKGNLADASKKDGIRAGKPSWRINPEKCLNDDGGCQTQEQPPPMPAAKLGNTLQSEVNGSHGHEKLSRGAK